MSKIYKVGIAGFGLVGERRRFFIEQHPNMKTVAVCDRKYENNGILPDGVKYFTDYKSLLEEELDILFVCLTNDIASEVTCAGLEKKLHVFCEKPPGRNVDDIRAVQVVEKKYPKLKLMYGFNHRYHESIKEALKIVSSGELGKVLNIRGVYGKSQIVSFKSDWRTKREIAGGGILLDQGIHMVDLMRLFAGEFSEIHSFIDNSFWKHDVEDNAYALMKSETGIVAFLHSTATQWRHRFHLDISLAKGSIGLSGILSGSKSYGAETITIAYKAENENGDPKEMTIRYNEDNSWRDEIVTFVDYILADKPVVSGSSKEALKTMELVYKIYCADKKWKDKYNLTV
jgi:predicted dehydrogenase